MAPSGSGSEQERTPEGMYRSTHRAAAVPDRPVNGRQASRRGTRAADRGSFPSDEQEDSDADAPVPQQKAQNLGRGQRHKKASVTDLHAAREPEVNKRPRRAAAQRLGACIHLGKQHVCCHLIWHCQLRQYTARRMGPFTSHLEVRIPICCLVPASDSL